jgi:hypothetical protein
MIRKVFTGLLIVGIGFLLSFGRKQSAITGRVSPANAANEVWVLGKNDSIRAGLSSGHFSVMVGPGTYKLVVDAREPFKDALLDNLDVKSNQVLDVGEIILRQ